MLMHALLELLHGQIAAASLCSAKQQNTVVFTMASIFVSLLQPLRWCCVDCVIHHERDVNEE